MYTLHFSAYTRDVGAYQEYKRGIERYGDWFDPPLKINDGKFVIPTGPGVGIADPAEVLKGAKPYG